MHHINGMVPSAESGNEVLGWEENERRNAAAWAHVRRVQEAARAALDRKLAGEKQ